MSYVSHTQILNNRQFSFLAGKSDHLQHLKATDQLTENMDQDKDSNVIYFDLRKAFDCVPY